MDKVKKGKKRGLSTEEAIREAVRYCIDRGITTGEVYKTGTKKGQLKTRKEFRYDGVRYVWDWAVQLNYYRMLLEKSGFEVNRY